MGFDMSGSGLAQMDMDLMRFIVNCFKIYFPDLLGMLLVFNMPWVLRGEFCSALFLPISAGASSMGMGGVEGVCSDC